jgi:uncharacterized protein YacL
MWYLKVRLSWLAFILVTLSVHAYATTSSAGGTQLQNTLCQIYNMVDTLVPIIAFVLFVLSGAAYAAGQFFGAEMRARAQGWSMSMLTGAIIGLIIVMLSGIIIKNLTQQDIKSLCKGVT